MHVNTDLNLFRTSCYKNAIRSDPHLEAVRTTLCSDVIQVQSVQCGQILKAAPTVYEQHKHIWCS